MRCVAIIPARGGSKTIPRKNIKLLHGLPLIAYSIAAARAARSIDGFWVSTEDDEIARVAEACHALVLRRSPALAADDTKTIDVLLEALQQLDRQGVQADAIVTLQPTSPLRDVGLVDRAVALLQEHAADSVVTITETSPKLWRVDGQGVAPLYDVGTPRQAMPPLYVENGNVYVTRRRTLETQRSVAAGRIQPLIIDAVAGLDIDTAHDWSVAEMWLEQYANRFGWQEVGTR